MDERFKLKMKKTIKKIAALTGSALILGATIAGALAASDLKTLPSPFVKSDGTFDAYVVVGKNAKTDDVVGAIEVASAFAQKATATGAGSGTAGISVKTFSGTPDATTPIYSSENPNLRAGYGASTDEAIAVLPNYTYTKDSTNYTAVEYALITNVTVDEHLGLKIPAGYMTLTAQLLTTLPINLAPEQTVRVAKTNYYIVNFTQSGNVSLGTKTTYERASIPWNGEWQGHTFSVDDVNSTGAAVITIDGNTSTGVTSHTVGGITITVDSVWVGALTRTANIGLITSTERWEHGKDWPVDTRFTVDLSDPKAIVLKNKADLSLSDLGNITGPNNAFTFYYKEKTDKMADYNHTITVPESQSALSGSFKVNTTYNKWDCYTMPGTILYRRDPTTEIFYTINCGYNLSLVDGDILKLVDADGTYAQFKVNTTTSGAGFIGNIIIMDRNTTAAALTNAGDQYNSSGGTTFTKVSGTELTFSAVGTTITAAGNSYSIRYGVAGVYSGGIQQTTPLSYGEVLTFDGTVFKFKEPDNTEWSVTFDKNETAFYVKAYSLPANNTKSSYGSLFKWDDGFQDLNSTAGTLTITVPRKDATYAIGGYVMTPMTLSVGGEQAVGNTTIRLDSVGGVVMKPMSIGFAKLDDMGTPTKPVIIVGGPCANSLAAQALGVSQTWPACAVNLTSNRALIQLIDNAFGSYTALVIAGYDAKDTVLASQVVAAELQGNDVLAGKFNGTKLILDTSAGVYTGITVVE
jgi:hypothetical protein